MIPFLFLLSTVIATPVTVEPHDPLSPTVCDEIAYELYRAVEYDIITPNEARDVYLSCVELEGNY